jgi:hypothetical protein
LKNTGKMQFFIGVSGNRGFFSGFLDARGFEWNSVIFFSLEGDSQQFEVVRSRTRESDRWERHGRNWKKESRSGINPLLQKERRTQSSNWTSGQAEAQHAAPLRGKKKEEEERRS